MLKKIHLGKNFYTEHKEFLCSNNLAEYDLIFWHPSSLYQELGIDISKVIQEDHFNNLFLKVKNRSYQIYTDFLSKNGIFIIFSNTLHEIKVNFLEPFSHIENTSLLEATLYDYAKPYFTHGPAIYQGPKIDTLHERTQIKSYKYACVFKEQSLIPLFLGERSKDVVGGYYKPQEGGIIIFAPTSPEPINKNTFDEYCLFLEKLGLFLLQENTQSDIEELPEWAKNYMSESEFECLNLIEQHKSKIHEHQNSIETLTENISKETERKNLFWTYDEPFEIAVKEALEVLGCPVERGPKAHADLLANIFGQLVVIEAKGLKNSASDGNVNQCKKWVMEVAEAYTTPQDEREACHEEYCKILERLGFNIENLQSLDTPKGILVINSYRELPLEKRERAFPDNIDRSLRRNSLCGLTGLQLYGISLLKTAEEKEIYLKAILQTDGCFSGFDDFGLFLKTKVPELKSVA